MSIRDSSDTTVGQMIDLARRNQREVAGLRRALAASQDRRRKAEGELALLRDRLTRTLDRLDADEDIAERYGAGPDFAVGVDRVIRIIRKELER